METKDPQSFSLDTLEFGKTLKLYERFLRTPLSVETLRASRPTRDIDWLRDRFLQVDQASTFLQEGHNFPFEGFSDIGPVLKQAELEGAACDGPDLLRVLENLQAIDRLSLNLKRSERPLGPLNVFLDGFHPLPDLQARLEESLDSDGTLKDSASPALRKIRIRISRQRSHIQKRLDHLIKRSGLDSYLSGDYYTERRGRYVLPVQSNHKGKLQGIRHGRSDTGTTSFIEPLELVEPGNLLAEGLEEEHREVVRVLRELTAHLRGHIETLRANLETAAKLDLVVSLADYNMEVNGFLPTLTRSGDLVLNRAKHPLLLAGMEAEDVVANDILLRESESGVLITGPNTGGKTIALKTAGLLSTLALSGLPIPCGPNSAVPLLGGVLADIGDEQSIEQSLSTFSSHIAHIESFLEVAHRAKEMGAPRVLVILDELGAGTDPAEGAPLGRAVLEALIEAGAWVLVATHLGDLKIFGHDHPGLVSASMKFDTETLTPKFELQTGMVGESHGIEIADRLGLPKEIIARAQALIEADPNQSAKLLHRLTEEERAAREAREAIELTKAEIEEKRDTLVRRIEQNAKQEKKILEAARREAESKVTSAKQRVARIEEHLEREETNLKKGYSGRESDLEAREKEIGWMERELQRRMNLLADLVTRYPNMTPEALREMDLKKVSLGRINEPEWKKILRALNEEEETVSRDFGAPETPSLRVQDDVRPEWKNLEIGDRLKVEGIEALVTIESKDEKRKRIAVSIGNMRSEIAYNRVLQRFPRARTSAKPEPKSGTVSYSRPEVGPEIHLIGKTVEEIEAPLQRYLDDAVLNGHDQVRVVHGFGTGILREAVRRILKAHPQVRKFRAGEEGEGGGGATVAALKG